MKGLLGRYPKDLAVEMGQLAEGVCTLQVSQGEPSLLFIQRCRSTVTKDIK